MSGSEIDDPGADTLAAEYVLGTLDEAEMRAAKARQLTDSAFAGEIRFWEQSLFPLTALAAPVEPPAALWTRIEASIDKAERAAGSPATRHANDNAVALWRGIALASMAVAASLAALLVLRPVPTPVFAVLSPTGSAAAVLVAFTQPGGGVALRPSGDIVVAAGRDLQLWSLPSGATRPASLGLLRGGGALLPAGVAPGTKLLVSLEPSGGSPTGQPTGPVVYGGVLRDFR